MFKVKTDLMGFVQVIRLSSFKLRLETIAGQMFVGLIIVGQMKIGQITVEQIIARQLL